VTTASNVLHTRKPVAAVADLSGQKVRAAGALQMGMMNALGASAVGNIRGPEIAEALSRSLLDGALMDWIGIKEFRLDRLAVNHVDYDFGRLATSLVINADKLASLPEPARAAFAKHGGLAYAVAGGKAFDQAVNEYRADYLKTGQHKAGTFSAADTTLIQKSFVKVVDDWKKGAPGRDKLVETYRKAAADTTH
jgi:TRAP-type C4-dicarboxylate transport system substrate-binding protein